MAPLDTNRFSRYGSNVNLDTVIKDCQALQQQVDSQAKTIASLEERLKKLESN